MGGGGVPLVFKDTLCGEWKERMEEREKARVREGREESGEGERQ